MPFGGESLQHENGGDAIAPTGGLSDEMLWVIILSVICLVVCLGCLVAYCFGVRHSKQRMPIARVGRPAMRRSPNSSKHDDDADADTDTSTRIANGGSGGGRPSSVGAVAAPNRDVEYLIELGRNIERQRSEAASPARQPAHLAPTPSAAAAHAACNLSTDGVSAALAIINDVRALAESLSPRTPNATSAKIEAAASLEEDSRV